MSVDATPLATQLHRPFLMGQKVYLRPLEMADVTGPYLTWLNDYEVTRFMETGVFPTTAEGLQKYVETVADSPTNIMLAIMEKKSNQHVGNIKLGSIQWIHRRADLGIMIGEKSVWGKGYGKEAMELVLEFGFKRLQLNKIFLGVFADHHPAVESYQKLGFVIEGTLKEHLFRDGQFRDEFLMGVLRSDYEKRQTNKGGNRR